MTCITGQLAGFQNAGVCLQAFPSCLAPFFITLKILISCGYPLPSLSVKHYLVGNNFLTQIIYTYANTVDRDQVNVNKKISKKQELQITHCTIIPQQYIEPSNCEIMVTNGLFGIKCNYNDTKQ